MTDIVDPETRSRMMSSIRGKDTKPELIVRRYLHRQGFRFRLHVRGLPGRPDIVLPKYGTIVEVRGCFWHQHEDCPFATMPSTNPEFWQTKLSGNRDRDLANKHKLEELDWVVFEVWECEVSDQEELHNLATRIESQICL
jgi:DNA mismatch endonuclease (patch repair protein)